MPDVQICDVTLRDGMQAVNRNADVPLALRLKLAKTLQRAGLPYLEVGSFINPKVISAMADTPELVASVEPREGQQLAALVPKLRYYRQFAASPNVDTVAVLVSASEKYAHVNTRMNRDQALEAACEVSRAATADGYHARAYLSYAFRDMGAAEEMPPELVVDLCERLLESGCEVIALSDTDGRATPKQVEKVITHLAVHTGLDHIGVHLHDRYGLGLTNALLAFHAGVRIFDSAVGGVGGNKLLKNSVGNIATEELVYMLHCLDVDTGVDFDALLEAGEILLEMVRQIGDPAPPSKILANRPRTSKAAARPVSRPAAVGARPGV